MIQRKIVCFLAGMAVLFSLAGCIRIKIRWNSEEMQGSFPAESYPSEFYSVSEQAGECLPKAVMNTAIKSDGTGFYIRAVYEEDADFQEEMLVLISAFQEEYGEFSPMVREAALRKIIKTVIPGVWCGWERIQPSFLHWTAMRRQGLD